MRAGLVARARIVLLTGQGVGIGEIAARVGTSKQTAKPRFIGAWGARAIVAR
jgi:hypothetical protein